VPNGSVAEAGKARSELASLRATAEGLWTAARDCWANSVIGGL